MSSMVIGLMGVAGSGKSTAAARMVEHHNFAEMSFAAPLKDLCAQQFGWDVGSLGQLSYKEEQDPNLPEGWTRRRVLQFVGTDCFRHIDPDHWAKRGAIDISLLLDLVTDRVVIHDVRFPNEVNAIRRMGGYVGLVNRLGYESPTPQHESELAWKVVHPDFVITSKGGIDKLWDATDQFMVYAHEHFGFDAS